MDNSQPIFDFNDTRRTLEKPSLDSNLENTATVSSRNSQEPDAIPTSNIHIGTLNQRLNVNRELSALEAPRIEGPIADKGFCCVNGSEGLKYYLDGQPILFNSYIPVWERSPKVSSETYMRHCLKRSNGFDSNSLPFPKKLREYEPKKNIFKASCLALNVALQSGLLEQDVALLLNPESKLKYNLLTLKGKHTLGTQVPDISPEASDCSDSSSLADSKFKKYYTPKYLGRFWFRKLKSAVKGSHSEAVKAFPKVLCSVLFYNDYAHKYQIRKARLRLFR
ncbi:hypothetical protein DSO57_1002457 [Entomophthora muscae]|uniref:Uncharacterized protein n=1 Tax=Entomophthora muscae TaxID=34485 RepID=A0ACC2RZU9_9FUNG|nr:hypothetical protein DSO57_1002457 [Entomophthora muscae]